MSETVRETKHEGQEGTGTDSAARILSEGTGGAHTPGPWSIVERYEDALSIVDREGFEHVTAESHAILLGYAEKLGIQHWADSQDAQRDISPEEQFANARLIAAAPDMADALATLFTCNLSDLPGDVVAMCRAALAKAGR